MATSILDQPVASLESVTQQRLGGDLTLRNSRNRDWTGVADRVGFSSKQVELLQQHQDSGKGYLFLKTWDGTGESSVKKLVYALLDLKMVAVMKILQEDEKLSDEEFRTVEAEYDQLKQDNKLKFRDAISDRIFYQTLYSRPNTCVTYPVSTETEECHVERLARDQCASPDVSIELKTVYISSCVFESILSKTKSSITKLAEFLHGQRFKVYYEPFCKEEIKNMGGLNAWKEYCIQRSENIIVVCTPTYHQEDGKYISSQSSHSTKPSKISVDSRLLRLLAYSHISSEKARLIPVVLDTKKTRMTECVPIWLQSSQLYHCPSGNTDLLYALMKQPKYKLEKPRPEDLIIVKPTVIGFPKQRARKTPK